MTALRRSQDFSTNFRRRLFSVRRSGGGLGLVGVPLLIGGTAAAVSDRLCHRFTGFARALLDATELFLLLAGGELQIVVGELGPLLLDLALGNVPIAFDFQFVHRFFVLCFVFLFTGVSKRRN